MRNRSLSFSNHQIYHQIIVTFKTNGLSIQLLIFIYQCLFVKKFYRQAPGHHEDLKLMENVNVHGSRGLVLQP